MGSRRPIFQVRRLDHDRPNGQVHLALAEVVSGLGYMPARCRRIEPSSHALTWTHRLNEVGAEERRTDEHCVYEGIVPEDRRRLCLMHWRKSKGTARLTRTAKPWRKAVCWRRSRRENAWNRLRQPPRAPTAPEDRWVLAWSE